jgi:archaellum component FlaC
MANEAMARLEAAREKVNRLSQKKARLQGEMEAKQQQLEKLEERARKELGCEIEDIPDLVEELDRKANEALARAEELLKPPKPKEELEPKEEFEFDDEFGEDPL